MDDSTRFSNYIIKKIVGHVDFDEATGDFSLQKVYMTDDILHDILEEGKRYGMPEEQVRFTVYRISSNIVTSPSITVHYSDLDSRKIPQGTHFELHFLNKTFGKFHVGLVAAGKGLFVVVESDARGLNPLDIVFSSMPIWNLYYTVELYRRNSSTDLNDYDTFALTALDYYAVYTPSVIYEIYDSQDDYSHERTLKEQNETKSCLIGNIITSLIHFKTQPDASTIEIPQDTLIKDNDWWDIKSPDGYTPIAFSLFEHNKCQKEPLAPFHIILTETGAALTINSHYCIPKQYTVEYDAIIRCCNGIKKELSPGDSFQTLSPGVLQYNKKLGRWILVKKPLIKTH